MDLLIGIIEDDHNLRDNIERFFSLYPEIKIIFSVNSIEKFLRENKSISQEPSLIFIDIGLPGISGIEGIGIIRKSYPNSHIVMISGTCNEETVWQAVSAGANGYLLKPLSLKKIIEQIDIIKNNGALISPEVASMLFSRIAQKTKEKEAIIEGVLTKRELDVVDYLLKGQSYKEIADKLFISYSTVNDHIKKIYSKLEINSKGELLALFIN
ncbi:DNA-binding NarL/FixJ family response regulator [Arcicella sp. BE140]|uniref:response regulator transcription factor n=2 Tax=Arcicella TaxID=217140 RepID=UPI0028610688|nr:response regulator transcription factor [Arcicella sp. BE140]MDR6563468.1 DNA-binding NarL/FixJ family response regulator [Arcicella sp. BE51]MDR6813420.1 DNA-binding NarL/FixJ family response regulator [Arcicella sp. BE140]MDR6824733.1 DNA-binding NarL/FixJ family response regulator [Arcicella sp. BE139]